MATNCFRRLELPKCGKVAERLLHVSVFGVFFRLIAVGCGVERGRSQWASDLAFCGQSSSLAKRLTRYVNRQSLTAITQMVLTLAWKTSCGSAGGSVCRW